MEVGVGGRETLISHLINWNTEALMDTTDTNEHFNGYSRLH